MRRYAFAAIFSLIAILLGFASEVAAAPTSSFAIASASLPSDIEIVATSNLKQVKASDTFKRVFPELLKLAGKEVNRGIDKVTKTCGIDPVSSFDDATIGVDKTQKGALFVALNGVSEQKFLDCLTKIGKAEGAAVTAKKSGGITEVKSDRSSKSLFYAWLTGDVVAIGTDVQDRALLERMIGGKGGLARSKIAARLAKVDSSAALVVVSGRAIPIDKMTINTADVTLNVRGGNVSAVTNLEMDSSRSAEKLAGAAKLLTTFLSLPKSAPKELEKILSSIEAKSNGNEVRLTASASERDLVTILNWAMKLGFGA